MLRQALAALATFLLLIGCAHRTGITGVTYSAITINAGPTETGITLANGGAKVCLSGSVCMWDNSGLVNLTGALTTTSYISSGGNFISGGAPGQFYASSGGAYFFGNQADGATAVGSTVGSYGAYSTTGAKVVAFAGNIASGTPAVVASIDKDGNISLNHLSCAMSTSTTCTATVPTGSKCACQATAGSASAVSCNVSSTTATCTASASNSSTWNILVW